MKFWKITTNDPNRTRTHIYIQPIRRLGSHAGRYVRLRNYKQVEGKEMTEREEQEVKNYLIKLIGENFPNFKYADIQDLAICITGFIKRRERLERVTVKK